MHRSHTPIVLQENTQKSIENMNFELRRSIIPQFQSLPKSTFSTNNISQKIGILLNFCITFLFITKKMTFDSLLLNDNLHPKVKENIEHDFGVINMFHNKCSMWTAATHPLLYTKTPKNLLEIWIFNWRDQSYRSFNHPSNSHFQRTILHKKSD